MREVSCCEAVRAHAPSDPSGFGGVSPGSVLECYRAHGTLRRMGSALFPFPASRTRAATEAWREPQGQVGENQLMTTFPVRIGGAARVRP